MKKDIFIDNNVACRFNNPLDPELKELVQWLIDNNNNADDDDNSHIVLSKKLLAEYNRSCMNNFRDTCIHVIIALLTQEGKIVFITNDMIKDFRKKFFKKKVERALHSNRLDWDHIPTILLSDRQLALAHDNGLIHDVNNFAGFNGKASKRVEDLDYKF